MKEIKLTQNQSALVDDEDFDYLNQFKWHCKKDGKTYYAVCSQEIKGIKRMKMHRLIMDAKSEMMIDHKDCNGLNNQKENLRVVNKFQNGQNRKPNNNRKYKGVRKGHNGVFESRIQVNGKGIHLGTFRTELDAAIAYNNAANKYFGEYAHLNNIEILPFKYKVMMLT